MKHLKSYNETIEPIDQNLSDDVIQNLKDICLELQDEGFVAVLNRTLNHRSANLRILRNNFHYFHYLEAEEVIERIKDFMKSKGYDTTVEKLKDDKLMWGIDLIFKNQQIKIYNEQIELSDNILQELKDICLELEDVGFTIGNHLDLMKFQNSFGIKHNYRPAPFLVLFKRKFDSNNNNNTSLSHFKYKEIEEVVERIEDYMLSQGYKTIIHKQTGIPDKGFYEIKLEFYNKNQIVQYNETLTKDLPENVKSNLRHICFELTDDCGFNIEIGFRKYKNMTSAIIQDDYAFLRINKEYLDEEDLMDYKGFYYTDVEEVVERVKDYMESEGYTVSIKFVVKTGRIRTITNFEWIDSLIDNQSIDSVLVYFPEQKNQI